MSSTVSAIFRLELRNARWQFALAIAAVLACALVPWSLRGWPAGVQFACSAAGLLVCLFGTYRANWLSVRCPWVIACDSAGAWCLSDQQGRILSTPLHVETRSFRRFIWLRFAPRHCLLIGPGDLDPEAFRRLQVMLRRPAGSLRERVA